MRIWAKTLVEDKIKRDCVYDKSGKLSKVFFECAIRDVCELMDIPCPIILASHLSNFASFNVSRFLPADFVESVDFECLVIENITVE